MRPIRQSSRKSPRPLTRHGFATTTPGPTREPSIQVERAAFAYQPSLDGLRAVAVLAVMAFHANLPWAEGGFYGVDVFFVLSGFLITTLLAREQEGHRTIRLGRFYMRRTLRLLPALLTLVVVLHVWSLWFVYPEQVRQLRRESAATLLYVANWAQIAGYIKPLGFFGHAWSLAIEEQFYIVWPLALGVMLRHLSRTTILAVIASAAVASALWRAVLAGDPDGFSRAFHGSDTRAEALLIGCFLAMSLQSPAVLAAVRRRRAAPVLGAAAAAVLALMFTLTTWPSPGILRGGLTVTALATAMLILHLQAWPGGALARTLAWRPLAATGQISYGLYLWQQPVILTLTPAILAAGPVETAAVRFAVTFAMAILSWVIVERFFLKRKKAWEAAIR
ncbi:MAG: acyltransferase family protein [Candidatus Binatia bacterium]